MAKVSNKKNKKDNKYSAENEIIIGVTTKPKEKVRVDTKATRTKNITNKSKSKKNIKKTNTYKGLRSKAIYKKDKNVKRRFRNI